MKRFDLHIKNATNHYRNHAFCLKADIKHYFEEVDHEILLRIIETKIEDEGIIWLIKQILRNIQLGANTSKECHSATARPNFSQTYILEGLTIISNTL